MKTLLKTFVALTALTAAAVSFAAPTQFKAGQRLTADQLNNISSLASLASQALGLGDHGNAVIASSTDLNQSIATAAAKAAKNCQQAVCTATVYLQANTTYTINTSSLNVTDNVNITTLGQSTATIALNNATLSVGKNVSFNHVNLISGHSDALQKQLANSQVKLSHVTFS